MRRIAAFVVALAAAGGCATRPPHPEAFAFAALGDSPYDAREEVAFDAMLERMAAEPLAFALHVGDFKAGGNAPCTDALYAERRARLDRSAHALVLTPGDNDWTDCRRDSNGRMDPLDRLARLREVFFPDAWSMGRARLPLARQDGCAHRTGTACDCAGLPENSLWTKAGVVFATIHVVGSNDNRGFDAANDAEQRCRAVANRAWLERAVRLAEGDGQRGLVVALQANLWNESRDNVYAALIAQLTVAARRLAKPVLLVHGDTHTYRVDRPFFDGSGKRVESIVRLEVPGSPEVGWVRVTVDPGDAALFRFDLRAEPNASGG